MSHHHVRSSLVTILSAALLLATPFAASAAQTQRVEVKADDLNLATDAGRAVLRQRIARAADTVCDAYEGLTTAKAPAYGVCLKAARASAATQFDAMVAAAASNQKLAASR